MDDEKKDVVVEEGTPVEGGETVVPAEEVPATEAEVPAETEVSEEEVAE